MANKEIELTPLQEQLAVGEEALIEVCRVNLGKKLDMSSLEVAKHFPQELGSDEQDAMEYYGVMMDACFEGYTKEMYQRELAKRVERGDSTKPMTMDWATTKIPCGRLEGVCLGILDDEQVNILWEQRWEYESDVAFMAKLKYWQQNRPKKINK